MVSLGMRLVVPEPTLHYYGYAPIDLETETSLLRESLGSGDPQRLTVLERALLEEQLLTSDLRRKLQSADKQNGVLTMRIRRFEMELGKSPTVVRLGVLGSEVRHTDRQTDTHTCTT